MSRIDLIAYFFFGLPGLLFLVMVIFRPRQTVEALEEFFKAFPVPLPKPRKSPEEDPWAIKYPPGIEKLIEDRDVFIVDLVLAVEQWVESGEELHQFQMRKCRNGHALPQGKTRCYECDRRNTTPLIPIGTDEYTQIQSFNGKVVRTISMPRKEFRLFGGPYDGETVSVIGEPFEFDVRGVPYRQITDPDSGAFLGGYAAPYPLPDCRYCGGPAHKYEGTHAYDPDYDNPSEEEALRSLL